MTVEELEQLAIQVRRDIVKMVYGAQSGHPGGSLGCADFLTALYFDTMKFDAKNFTMDGIGEDLFFLSNGHISPVFYSVLSRSGYFPTEELSTFRFINSRLQGHPTPHEGLPGVRIASGSLGQGISVAIGAAMAKKLNKDDRTVYCLAGDGELDEGQNWEAILFGPAKKVDNLILTIDVNGQQIDGTTQHVLDTTSLGAKFTAFNWEVMEMDGNNMQDVVDTLKRAKDALGNDRPIVILMRTVMGKGVDFMEGTHEWHGIAPNEEQLKKALEELQPKQLADY